MEFYPCNTREAGILRTLVRDSREAYCANRHAGDTVTQALDKILRRQINALIPSERVKVCLHSHTPFRARHGMPCTGPLVCTMCGQTFAYHADRDAYRSIAIANNITKG